MQDAGANSSQAHIIETKECEHMTFQASANPVATPLRLFGHVADTIVLPEAEEWNW